MSAKRLQQFRFYRFGIYAVVLVLIAAVLPSPAVEMLITVAGVIIGSIELAYQLATARRSRN